MKVTIPARASTLVAIQNAVIWEFPGNKVCKLAWAANVHKFIAGNRIKNYASKSQVDNDKE
jgi:hypothetical protein